MAVKFAAPVAAKLVPNLAEFLFAPIGRQFGYVLRYKSNVKDLKDKVKELEAATERVEHAVEEAVNNGKSIENDIKNWLENAKNKAKEAQDLLKHSDTANDACFRGWLPNPVVRLPIGRKVKKMISVIQGLHDKSKNKNFEKVYFDSPPIGIVTASTSTVRSVDKEDNVLESRASMIEKVVEAITDDKVHVVGVWGPGGIGKSMLLEDVERRIKEQRMFDWVTKANVSDNFDLYRIQGEIAYKLGMKLTNDETADERAVRLHERLESDHENSGPSKKILIILDDLWEKLELQKVGIPHGSNNKVRGCKLLLASRKLEVLLIDMGSDREFRLNELEHEEARRLFVRTVGDRVNDPDFRPWVDRIVENCGGLPLSIVHVATRLKHKKLPTWRNAATNRDLSDVKSLVESSYNDLNDERIQSLFLICALTSGRISMRRFLVYYCMGLGLYRTFSNTLGNVRDRFVDDIGTLQNSSLLLESDDTEKVRMHDLLVDVANSMRCKFLDTEWKPLVGKKEFGFKEWSEIEIKECTAMSLSYVGIDELPEKLDCPNLRMLLLFEKKTSPEISLEISLQISESFFESVEKLQVLHFSWSSFTSLPSSVQFLGHLKSLSLHSCYLLKDVTILGKLERLQFLSFNASLITELPTEIGKLKELRVLDLTGCINLIIIKPGVLERLVNLEELYLEEFWEWEAEDEAPRSNASLAELKSMKKLKTVCIAIPQTTLLSSDLPFGNLDEHTIQIGGKLCWFLHLKESRTLHLTLDSDNLLREEWMEQCLERTQHLRVAGLQDGRDSIHDMCMKGFKDLKDLDVQNSLSFHYVLDSTQRPAFTRLESLVLRNLNNLKKICCDYLAPESFSKLETVIVENCSATKQLFPSSAMRILLRLEEITITSCCLMEQIIEDANEIEDDANVKSFKLRRLLLENLPEMTSFCKTRDHSNALLDGQQVSLPSLESLTLSELPKLRHIWNSQLPFDVSKLKFLEVKGCASLLSIIPSNLLIELQNLEAATVENCQLIREVFDFERPIVSEEVKILSRLTTLTLSNLPRLEHIWSKDPGSCLQNLRVLVVQHCDSLRYIFSSSMAKTPQQIKEIRIVNCKLLEEIIDVQEEESEEAISIGTIEFPLLTSLYLEKLPNLRTFSYGTYHMHCPTLSRLNICGCPKMMTFSSFERKQQGKSCSLPVLFANNVVFPKLEELHLSEIQSRGFCENEMPDESFRQLKILEVKQCPNLLNAIPSLLWNCMQSLTVVSCPRLRNLFTMSTANNLAQLQYLVLVNCEEMEYVVAAEEEKPEEAAGIIVLPKLVSLRLSNMMKLKSFLYQGKHTSEWPSLKELTVKDCKAVEAIIGDASCRRLEGNVSTCQPLLLVEKVEFPNMESMKILHMDNMEQIWLGELTSNAFTKLKTLKVKYCEKLSSIFTSHTILTRFQNLEEIIVTDCGSLEVVFQVQEFNFSETHSTSKFELLVLILKRLPKMKHIWSGHLCGTLAFECLLYMEATSCESLKSLFPVSIAKSMTQFINLKVRSCEVEEIIAEEVGVRMSSGDFFPNLTTLFLFDLPELRSFYRSSHTKTWPLLKELWVSHCDKMKLFSFAGEFQSCQGTSTNENRPALVSFEKVSPNLEILSLTGEDVVMLLQQRHFFGDLRFLSLSCFHDENDTLPSDLLLQRFPKLQMLDVRCSSFEEIFPEDASGHEGAVIPCGWLTNVQKHHRRPVGLIKLSLNKLGNLRRVWKEGSLMAELLKQIEDLYINECPRLSIVLPSLTTFQNLENLTVKNCPGLVHMGTCLAVTSLVHLFSLTIKKCVAMEDVVTDDENGVNGAKEISFPKMEELKLEGLPRLESFSSTSCAFSFPSLKYVVVKECPKMNIFCNGALRTPKLAKVLHSKDGKLKARLVEEKLLSIGWRSTESLHKVIHSKVDDEEPWEGDLNATVRILSA